MPANSGNYLLPQLAAEDFELLRPHLHEFDLVQGATLVEQGQPIEYVYFPYNGIISLVVHLRGGGSVEAVMIGRDGVLGATAAAANPPYHAEAVVQISGAACRLSVRSFREVYGQSIALRTLMVRYSEAMTVQAQLSAACNATHPVPERLARWLLKTGEDLMADDVLPFTQEFLSHMLGVRRPSVTQAIRYSPPPVSSAIRVDVSRSPTTTGCAVARASATKQSSLNTICFSPARPAII